MFGKYRNVALEKNGEDQLDRSLKKIIITKKEEEKEYAR
jgi:hypothetical protein